MYALQDGFTLFHQSVIFCTKTAISVDFESYAILFGNKEKKWNEYIIRKMSTTHATIAQW